MKLLETYSRNTSVNIKHLPKIVEKYFPLGGINKYITLQTKSGMPAKDYSYFQEVITIISPELEKQGIKILHLGQDSTPLQNTINLNGQTSISQAAFLLKNSLLHLGCDSWMCHYCGAENVPLVSLYGSTTIANHSPYHYNKEKTVFLESHKNGNKASFAREENPKTIDLIFPENVAKAVLELLNLPYTYEYETIAINQGFNFKIVEMIPDHNVDIRHLNIEQIIIRADLKQNDQIIANQLQIGKATIVTDLPINTQILTQLRQNIVEIIYIITKNHQPEFVKQLKELKIPYKLISYLKPEELNTVKLHYMDYSIINPQNNSPIENVQFDGTYFYQTNKYLLSLGKIYPSYYSYLNSKNIPNFAPTPQELVSDNIEYLYKDKDFCYFLKKKS